LGKLGSWHLLLVISYERVALIDRPQPFKGEVQTASSAEPRNPLI
jgi:hypothetical protein